MRQNPTPFYVYILLRIKNRIHLYSNEILRTILKGLSRLYKNNTQHSPFFPLKYYSTISIPNKENNNKLNIYRYAKENKT